MSSASSRSSPPGVAIEAAAAEVIGRVRGVVAPVVLIDGRSGSGKSTLASTLVDAWGASPAVVALDDVYPGWDGLDTGVAEVVTRLLRPRAEGADGRWRRWDWDADHGAEWHEVEARVPLIVEGSGILTPESVELADLAVWISSPMESRRERALARDGDLYRPHWDRWAAQEDRHVARDRPEAIADLVVEIP